jgi:predicted nucleic acid-binding protein
MRAVFADTCYWIALLNPRDQTHDIAIGVSKALKDFRTITTEEVLTELLNYFGARGSVLSHRRLQAGGADAGGPLDPNSAAVP